MVEAHAVGCPAPPVPVDVEPGAVRPADEYHGRAPDVVPMAKCDSTIEELPVPDGLGPESSRFL